MNDENYKGSGFDNSTPLQGGITLDSLFGTPKNNVKTEDSSLASLEKLSGIINSEVPETSSHPTSEVSTGADFGVSSEENGIPFSNDNGVNMDFTNKSINDTASSLDSEVVPMASESITDEKDDSESFEIPRVTIETLNSDGNLKDTVSYENEMSSFSNGFHNEVDSSLENITADVSVQDTPIPSLGNVPESNGMANMNRESSVLPQVQEAGVQQEDISFGMVGATPSPGLNNFDGNLQMGNEVASTEVSSAPQVVIGGLDDFGDTTVSAPVSNVDIPSTEMGPMPIANDILVDEAFQGFSSGMNVGVQATSPNNLYGSAPISQPSESSMQGEVSMNQSIPNMQVNPSVEPNIVHFPNDINDTMEYQKTPNHMVEQIVPRTEEDLNLEKRNGSGIRFIIVFGLIILIFIILLPFLSELL